MGNNGGEPDLANTAATMSINYLDSPSTTSAITYQFYFRNYQSGKTSYINNTEGNLSPLCSITCMEIKGWLWK